jgi:hypothetical protein
VPSTLTVSCGPIRKKSQGFKSGEQGDHGIGPFLSIHLSGGLFGFFFVIYFYLTFCLEEKQDIRKNSMLFRNCL